MKLLLVIMSAVTVLSGIAAVLLELRLRDSDRWGTRVYRATHYIELTAGVAPIININTAGMSVELAVWDGDSVRVRCVAELPLMISEEADQGFHEITISQDDGFAISFLTLDMFRYHLRICLPRSAQYQQINMISAGGDIDINGHHLRVLDRFTIETNNADVNILRGTSRYSIRTRSGDVRMDFDFVILPAEISSRSGNITLLVPDTAADSARELLTAGTQSGVYELILKQNNVPLL
jgi:hypothetical protein